MTKAQTLKTVKSMKKGDNSISVNNHYVIIKTGRSEWRVGELSGDWLMHGTAEQVVNRAFQPVYVTL